VLGRVGVGDHDTSPLALWVVPFIIRRCVGIPRMSVARRRRQPERERVEGKTGDRALNRLDLRSPIPGNQLQRLGHQDGKPGDVRRLDAREVRDTIPGSDHRPRSRGQAVPRRPSRPSAGPPCGSTSILGWPLAESAIEVLSVLSVGSPPHNIAESPPAARREEGQRGPAPGEPGTRGQIPCQGMF
jgi:hypothetical protein